MKYFYSIHNCSTSESVEVYTTTPMIVGLFYLMTDMDAIDDYCFQISYFDDGIEEVAFPDDEVPVDLQYVEQYLILDGSYNDCSCTINTSEIIIEDDVNLTLQKVMVQNEPLLSIKTSVLISNGVNEYELTSDFIELAQNYVGGYLDLNLSVPMPWMSNFPSGAVNNNMTVMTTGANLELKAPFIINWREFQTLPSLTSIFGLNANNNWLWFQEQGWQLKFKIETQNDVGVYSDSYDFNIRDYDDNPLIDWTWEMFRKSTGAPITTPIAGEITTFKVTGDMPSNSTTDVDYSTVTVEGIEEPTRWVISSVYEHLGQSNSPLQPVDFSDRLKQTNETTPNRKVVLEFDFNPKKIPNKSVKFTARSYSNDYSERTIKEFILPTLPQPKLENEFEKSGCCECPPELKIASDTSEELLHNDITGVVHKNENPSDTCEFKIYKGSQLLLNSGVDYQNGFPHDPNVSAFIFNWKYYLVNNGVGCYRIEKTFTVAGIEFTEEIGKYDLKKYTPENVRGTVRALVQYNFESLWNDSVINYADSGFEDSYRFRGYFGNWQPNTISDSNFNVDNTNRTSSIKSRETYELEHYMASECHFKRLHKIAMHTAVWRMSDHNPSNPLQSNEIIDCILEKEDAEQLTYTPGSRIASVKINLQKRQQNEISLFSGSIQLVQGVTWQLPTVTGGGGTCLDGTVIITDNNDNVIGTQEVESGGTATYKVVDLPCAVDEKSWVIQFIDKVEEIQMLANIGNIATFSSGSGADIGTLSVSTDGTTFAPISYPFTPSVGRYWFKRSTFLVSAEYKMIE